MESMESRLTELEIKISYSEELVETLNHTVFRQQEQITMLQRQLAELQRQVQTIPTGPAQTLPDELPPHY
mgnify:FL=1